MFGVRRLLQGGAAAAARRYLSLSARRDARSMRVAIIGQSAFASGVYRRLQQDGHQVVGVFTIPDKGREDPLAAAAREDGIPVFKIPRWRRNKADGGGVVPEVMESYAGVKAELNVLPFCSQFIPMEVIRHPPLESIVYHPSILPRHRGASAVNWTLIQGDQRAGYSVFWADDGLDTGPLLLQESCDVLPDDTVDSLYQRFLFPSGIEGLARAVRMIADGSAPKDVQTEEGATYDPMLNKPELCQIHFEKLPGQQLHNFIRGMDKVPGAWIELEGQKVRVYGSQIWGDKPLPQGGRLYPVNGMSKEAIVHESGMLLFGSDNVAVNVTTLVQENGKMISASKYGLAQESTSDIQLSEEEIAFANEIKKIWQSILRIEVEDDTDFFKSGAGSMDVARLIEEIKASCGTQLENEDIYMATTFKEFIGSAVLKKRGGGKNGPKLEYTPVVVEANNLKLSFPNQLFIGNQFVNSSSGKTLKTYNPADESLICEVQCASKEDVDKAVNAAKKAFEEGDWSKMNARDRGKLLYKLADLMEENIEELATLESLDSGAVYTLALKTHIGMSIDTFRYFAGWCDKIQGSTIPINHARPNRNLTLTKKEPVGVCALVTPWNYPLMMVAWKLAPCLAAGNTAVVKPAQMSPLTALKLSELAVRAGFPPGVLNVLPGTGRECGQAMAEHPLVRKLGFTGSTPVGHQILEAAAKSNLKRVSLELGGKSPLIIFGDCDLDRTVRQAMGGVFFNKGENCIAAGRLFVDSSIHDAFVEKVVQEVSKMAIGDPLDRSTAHGPQNHRSHLEKLEEYCQIGQKEGAKLVYGGKRVDRPGLFFTPTVFTEVTDDMFIAKEESFGPIMIISRFEGGDLDAVIARANNTEFALASGVFTKDLTTALRVADRIQAGTCFVNCYNKTDVAAPFGGFKRSGFGKDLGELALHEYLQTKCVTIEY